MRIHYIKRDEEGEIVQKKENKKMFRFQTLYQQVLPEVPGMRMQHLWLISKTDFKIFYRYGLKILIYYQIARKGSNGYFSGELQDQKIRYHRLRLKANRRAADKLSLTEADRILDIMV